MFSPDEYLPFGLSSSGCISASHKLCTSAEIRWKLSETYCSVTERQEKRKTPSEDKWRHSIFSVPNIVLCFCLSVCFLRDPQSLDPPEVSNAKLQYAGWGPKGQQLVSKPGSAAVFFTKFMFSKLFITEHI